MCRLYPTRFVGVCSLPQSPGVSPRECADELARCVNEFGFVGCNLNPDPSGGIWTDPPMTSRYWYPLYEKMVAMDVPALIHSASCKDPWDTYSNYFITTETRCIISMIASETFKVFPNLKIIVSHGGGAVPYQIGRYRAFFGRHFEASGGFDVELKKFYFDTVLYNWEGVDLLCRIVARSNDHLQEVLNRVLEVQGINRTQTVIALTEQIPYRVTPLVDAAGGERKLRRVKG